MEGTSKTRSLILMATIGAMAGMVGSRVHEVKLGSRTSAASLMSLSRRQVGRVMSSTYRNSFGRNAPTRGPAGTYWAGDGVMPAGESRQVRRARERAERKAA